MFIASKGLDCLKNGTYETVFLSVPKRGVFETEGYSILTEDTKTFYRHLF
jgi:hypothetical protein